MPQPTQYMQLTAVGFQTLFRLFQSFHSEVSYDVNAERYRKLYKVFALVTTTKYVMSWDNMVL